MAFRDRVEAGQLLGLWLQEFVKQETKAVGDVQILALPRGGVPVGFEVAVALGAPLDVFAVRKLGAPGREELAMGAIASGGVCVINADVVSAFWISSGQIDEVSARELLELERREQAYRGGRAALGISGKHVFVVDDGLATGYTMRAAISALRGKEPEKIVVAIPVGARSTCAELASVADAVVCLNTPLEFVAVGKWYRNFSQTSDEEVRELLERAAKRAEPHAA